LSLLCLGCVQLQATSGAVFGTVTDTKGNPMPGIGVILKKGTDSTDSVVYELETGEDGTYRIDNVLTGTYRLDFSVRGYLDLSHHPINLSTFSPNYQFDIQFTPNVRDEYIAGVTTSGRNTR